MTLSDIGLIALGVLILVVLLNVLVARWNDRSARGEM